MFKLLYFPAIFVTGIVQSILAQTEWKVKQYRLPHQKAYFARPAVQRRSNFTCGATGYLNVPKRYLNQSLITNFFDNVIRPKLKLHSTVTLTCSSISIGCFRDINSSLCITSIPLKDIIHKRIDLARTEIWI